jgi:hypothetical protein
MSDFVTAPPYPEMSLPALREELAAWDRMFAARVFADVIDLARRCRDECAAEIARREAGEIAA